MKKAILGIITIALLWTVSSCDDGYTELTSGYSYKLVKDVDGKKPVMGDIMLVDLKSVFGGDSVLIERTAEDGFFLDPLRGTPEKLKEVLALCDEGDSVHVKMSLMEYGLLTRMPITPQMDTTKTVVMQMRIAEIENESLIIERRKRDQLQADITTMEDYLKQNGLEATASPDNIYHVVREEGTGRNPVEGDVVAVNYVVRLIDGTLMDTSYEEVAKEEGVYNERRPYQPYEFTIGRSSVIQGWHKGIPLVKEGGKGTLLIPSALAYGPNPRSGMPPNAVLVFDVEVVSIK